MYSEVYNISELENLTKFLEERLGKGSPFKNK